MGKERIAGAFRKAKLSGLGDIRKDIEEVSMNSSRYREKADLLTTEGMALEGNLGEGYFDAEAEKHIRACALIGKELGALGRFYSRFERSVSSEEEMEELRALIDEAKSYLREQEGLGVRREGDISKYDRLFDKKVRFDTAGSGGNKGTFHEEAVTLVKELTRSAKKSYEIESLEATYNL